jgi:DNA-binding MarR family transcriptional regulator
MRKPQIALVADPQEHEGYLIKELYHLLRARIEARMRTAGIPLSFPHAQVLHELMHEPGLSSAQLARRCGVTPQTMIGLVAALEQQGIIERRVHPENARVMQCYVRTDRL